MAFTNAWVETDPDGAVITGSLLDDHQRLTKRAVRERLEGDPANPNSGIYEAGSFAATAIVRAGTARAYVVTAANLGTLTLQDGRMAFTSDTNRLYHLKGAGYVEVDYLSKSGGTATGQTAFTMTGGVPVIVQRGDVAAAGMALIQFQRNGVIKGYIGLDASDSLVIDRADGTVAITIPAAGVVDFPLGVSITGTGAAPLLVQSPNAAATIVRINNTAVGARGSLVQFEQNGVIAGYIGNLGALLGTSASTPVIWSVAGLGVEIYTNGNSAAAVSIGTTGTVTLKAQLNFTRSAGLKMGGDDAGIFGTATEIFMGDYATATKGIYVNYTNGVVRTTHDLVIPATKKVYLDGGGNTYIDESTADTMEFVTGGTSSLIVTATNIRIPATSKIYVDGGFDTYIVEGAANIVQLFGGGSLAMEWQPTYVGVGAARDFYVNSTKRVYLDGVGDTYLTESSANTISLVAGAGTGLFAISTGGGIVATNKLYLDSGGDTYLSETSANTVALVAGAVTALGYNAVGTWVTATRPFYVDGGSDTYIYESAANQFDIVAGGTNYFRVVVAGVQVRQGAYLAIDATQRLYLDSGSDTYILENSANVIRVVTGGTSVADFSSTGIALVSGTFTGNLTGTVLTASQTNITAVGTLGSVTVTGLADVGSLKVGGGATVSKILKATKTWDPPSIAANSFTTTTVTVTGAAVGDLAFVCAKNATGTYGNNPMEAVVTAADTVTIYLMNNGSAAFDGASDDFYVVVIRA